MLFSSSVTPHSTTKVHPVMSKLQAHMALAAMSQNQQSIGNNNNNNKLKHAHRPNSGSSQEFSPPSQIVSNYANYDTATRLPLWHHGFPTKSHNHNAHNVDFHHHVHKPESQVQQQYQQKQQQQILPSVHPSIITPFLEQVQIKQKEVAAAEQKNSYKQSQESSSLEHNGSFEVVNDVFSKHLVPPPLSTSKTHHKQQKPSKAADRDEKYPKLNLSMQSPLQDASRFNYNNVISTATPSSSSTSTVSPHKSNHDVPKYRPSNSENIHFVTEKPNVFLHLNRPKENPYKQHKLLHPSYTGGIKRPTSNQDKPFLPTPYKPEKEEEIKIDFEPQHSFFTIEDAVTPHFGDSLKYDHHEGSDELEIITLRPQVKPTRDYFTTSTSTTVAPLQIISSSTASHVEPTAVESPAPSSSSPKPRQKLRRRKPKPQNQQVLKEQQTNEEHQHESTSEKPLRTRGNIKSNNSTPAPEIELRTRNRLNHPNRVRTKPNLTTTPPAPVVSSSNDYDYTAKPFDEDLRRSEIATTQTTSEGTSSTKSIESSEIPDVIRHRVRLRYKSKLNSKATTSLEGIDFKQKLKDSQISDSENESVVVKQPSIEETTEFNVVTENPFVEIKSSLKLPNLKLRNEVYTTIPTTAEPVSSSTIAVENEENNSISQKISNRPRFSIKELKRKQFLTSSGTSVSTTILTSSTSSTTSRPDNQRFNRYRVNLNRRRNETNDSSSSEEIDTTRKRFSSVRYSSSPISTTSSTTAVDSTTKRTVLPKRIYTPRNFTRPTAVSGNESETTSQKPSIRNSTFVSNRPSTPSLRQRIQNYNYKKKDTSNEVTSDQDDSIKNLDFETIITHEQPSSTLQTTSTTTELPITRETSIMKIAKTPSSIVVNQPSIKSTTINSNTVIENTLSSSLTPSHDSTDLVGSPSEHSQRVAELTISANENSQFKSANIGLLSRRIPNYFTISTDDPILPIQAFFPQIKTNESVSFMFFISSSIAHCDSK